MTWHNIKTSSFTARMDTLETQTAIYIWDGIRLAKRHKRGQLSMHYLLYTLIQACNATLMFLWLNQLIDSPMYSWSGPSILVDLYNGLNWKDTGHFPRITHCDFTRRKLASVHTETVLCVLTLNIYYEKLLLFLWFWMLFVAIVSWFNCITWARIMCVPQASKFKLQSFLSVHAGSSVYMDRFFRELPTSYLTLAMFNILEQAEDNGDQSHSPLLIEKGTKAI
uniref:Innexin n=1 Tax=Ditylenchus dipsaci TaxID=166011 RepID=A0A915CM75_9BILA